MKTIVNNLAPRAIGPYSQAIQTGNLLYCSGQTPIDPETMKIEVDSIEEQTKRVIENLKLVLQEAGLDLRHVVKTNVFLSDMGLFTRMNLIYTEYFGNHKPARSTVAVNGLPMNALVEIECIAEFN
ncbi:MAG: reactive intermediate/imine deaminase [Marivirga sp.]|nr:reactive intermediate/imine deaminase [Marivirga sp.]